MLPNEIESPVVPCLLLLCEYNMLIHARAHTHTDTQTHTHTYTHTHTHTGKTLACVRLEPAGDTLTASVAADPSQQTSDYVTCPVDRLGHYM